MTHLDPEVRSNLGRRIKVKAELERAVMERCAAEFSEVWPHDDPATVRDHINAMAFHADFSGQAATCLSKLRESLEACLELQEVVEFGDDRDLDRSTVPNPLDEFARLRPGLADLEARWLKIRASWNQAWTGQATAPVGIRDSDWRDWPESRVLLRRVVCFQYSNATLPSGEPITDRNLAVVSLLAGIRKILPAKLGSTVSEIIIQETKAMKKVMEADGGAPVRRQHRDEV